MIAVIGAMDIEVEKLSSLLTNVRILEQSNRTFYIGHLHGKEVVVVKAGIGKVNSAVTTSILCENFEIDYIINSGIAGGVNVDAKTLVISRRAIYFDADASRFGYTSGQIPGEELFYYADEELVKKADEAATELAINHKVGTIATGDSFVTDKSQFEKILPVVDDLYAVEMEGASIAQTASMYNKPFIIIRSISDVVGSTDQTNDYEAFEIVAANNAAHLVELIIKK